MALFDMARKENVPIEAAHVNYHKRDTAQRDEDLVREYCKKYRIPFHLHDYEEGKYKGNFQANARKDRYLFFKEVCEENGLDEVLIAHQEDDLLETYLMQKEKKLGVSYYGLKERNVIEGVEVYRPLLSYTKKDLKEYCDTNHISYGIDESNLRDDYERNRIRHTKIEKMSEDQRNRLLNEIDHRNTAKQEHYERACEALYKEVYTIAQFKKIPYLKDYLSVHFPNRSSSFYEEMKRQLIESEHCLFEGRDVCFSKEYGKIYLFEKREDYSYVFETGKKLKDFKCPYFEIREEGEMIEQFSVNEEDYPLCIRNAGKGDQIVLRYGTKKVNRFFIDRKIPLKDRKTWPVVVNQKGEVIFIPMIGCDINHYCLKEYFFMLKL